MLSQIQARFQYNASGTGVVQSATFHCGRQPAEGREVFRNAVTVQVERSVRFIHGLAGRADHGVTTRQNRRDGKVGEVRRLNSSDRTGERSEVNAAFNGAHWHPLCLVPVIRVPELIGSLRHHHSPDWELGRTGRHLIQQYAGGPGATDVVVVELTRLAFVARPRIVELDKEPAPRTQTLIEVGIGIRRISCLAVDRQIFRSPIVKRERFADQQFRALTTPDQAAFRIDRLVVVGRSHHSINVPTGRFGKGIGEREDVELERRHDRIGIPEVDGVDRPLGDAVSRFTGTVIRRIRIKVDFHIRRLDRHHQDVQMLGIIVPDQEGIVVGVSGNAIIVMIERHKTPERLRV